MKMKLSSQNILIIIILLFIILYVIKYNSVNSKFSRVSGGGGSIETTIGVIYGYNTQSSYSGGAAASIYISNYKGFIGRNRDNTINTSRTLKKIVSLYIWNSCPNFLFMEYSTAGAIISFDATPTDLSWFQRSQGTRTYTFDTAGYGNLVLVPHMWIGPGNVVKLNFLKRDLIRDTTAADQCLTDR